MNKPVKIIIGLIVIVLIIWAIASGSHKKSDTSTNEKSVIKIGVIAPLTGGGSVFGNAIVGSLKLAEKDTANTKNEYKLIIEDDGTNPATAASAAQKLINVDKVNALITMTSGTGNAVAPIADSAKILHVCTCTDTRVGYGTYNYTNLVMPDDEGKAYADEAARRGIKKVAMLTQNHSGVNAIADGVKAALKAKGIQVVLDEKFEGTNRDFKTIVSKAKQTKADTYYVVSYPPALDILGKDLKDAGVKPISGSATFGVSADPSLYEGAWSTDGSVTPEFKARFEKELPSVRFNARSAAYGYDDYVQLVKGFESGAADIAAYWGSLTSFEGVAGHTVRDGNNFRSPASYWVVKDGKVELFTPKL